MNLSDYIKESEEKFAIEDKKQKDFADSLFSDLYVKAKGLMLQINLPFTPKLSKFFDLSDFRPLVEIQKDTDPEKPESITFVIQETFPDPIPTKLEEDVKQLTISYILTVYLNSYTYNSVMDGRFRSTTEATTYTKEDKLLQDLAYDIVLNRRAYGKKKGKK